ncbi:MAG: flagellar motor switch phosphatase FliY [Peptococcaceae bacterium]|jgi:flagellar motor switch protein FliN/FliY|nr:flagellar motor switch phosphatase FliY [Peptococcaceae bacterium]
MNSGMLSQEEIDALLGGGDEAKADEGTAPSFEQPAGQAAAQDMGALSTMELDALGEIANISMGTAATTLSLLLNKKVEITTPKVDVTNTESIRQAYPLPCVIVNVKYRMGIEGSNLMILSQKDGAIIVDLMMGGEGKIDSAELTELQISGISEAMNQMMGSAATSMSQMFNEAVDITPPELELCDLSEAQGTHFTGNEEMVRVSFRMVVGTVIDSTLVQVFPVSVARHIVSKLMLEASQIEASTMPPGGPPEMSLEMTPPPNEPSRVEASATLAETTGTGGYGYIPPSPSAYGVPPASVQPAQFTPLQPGYTGAVPDNLGLILDVPLQLSIELGKAKKTIKDILALGPGSVIELDRLAGEPVDMIVNGKLIAKCEVVVMNESFGVRITDIIQQAERVRNLN